MSEKLRALIEDLRKRAESALYIEANAIMSRSKREFVPVDDGFLQGSGHVEEPVVDNDGSISVRLGYGGTAGAYALAIHEFPDGPIPPSWRGIGPLEQGSGTVKSVEDIKSVRTREPWSIGDTGHGPKYLERPLRDASEGMNERLAARMKL